MFGVFVGWQEGSPQTEIAAGKLTWGLSNMVTSRWLNFYTLA
jgi:hypothetical protein